MPLSDLDRTPQGEEGRTARGWANGITALSQGLLRVEKTLAGGFMALLLGLILLNVVTRFLKAPIYWIDEASVFTMVWLGFIGASVMTRLRIDFAVTILADQLPPRGVAFLRALATGISLCFALGFVVMCWNWLDPLGIASFGFDPKAYAAETFNFLYTERTQTLEWPTWVVNLILPIFAVTLAIHTAANLLEDTGLAAKRVQIPLTTAEEAA